MPLHFGLGHRDAILSHDLEAILTATSQYIRWAKANKVCSVPAAEKPPGLEKKISPCPETKQS